MPNSYDFKIRVRHQSYRRILHSEIEKIDFRLGELLPDIYENELIAIDLKETLFSNDFTAFGRTCSSQLYEAMTFLSREFPEFMFQTDEHCNGCFEQVNYHDGKSDMSTGYIAYEPHHLVKF